MLTSDEMREMYFERMRPKGQEKASISKIPDSPDTRHCMPMEIKPSETNQDYGTGAVRGSNAGTGEAHLLPFQAILRIMIDGFGSVTRAPLGGITELAKLYEAAKTKYPGRNWEKGVPLARYVDSAFRHFCKHVRGDKDEPHLVQFAWNLVGLLQTHLWVIDGVLPASLIGDLPKLGSHCGPPIAVGELVADDYLHLAFCGLSTYVNGGGLQHLIFACGNALAALEQS